MAGDFRFSIPEWKEDFGREFEKRRKSAFALEKTLSKLEADGMKFREVAVTSHPIATPPTREDAACGAFVDFWGIVRPTEAGAPITGIEYSCHPRMTEPILHEIVERTAARLPLLGCRLVHRVGFVPAGEASLFLRAACAHRDAAYHASREMIEALKKLAPIWKLPVPGPAPHCSASAS